MAAGKRKSGSLVLVLVLIVIIGVVLVYLAMSGGLANIGQTPPTPTPNFDMVDIVVASQAIPRGNLISADVLTTIKYPLVEVPAGTFFSTVADAVGTKAKYNIEPGVPLTSNMVIKQNDGSLASFDIPAGMTAFSLSVSAETVVAYAPQKGDHVMVVGCMLLTDVDTQYQTRLPNNLGLTTSAGNAGSGTTALSIQPWSEGQVASQGRYEIDSSSNEPLYIVPSETQRPRLVCQTIIQDAMVLQLGNFALGAGMDASVATTAEPTQVNATQAAGQQSTSYPGSITLVVSPQDTIILNYLLLSGTKLSMALRGAGDMGTITTDPVTLQYVMDSKNIPSPVKLPYAIEPRVDSLSFPTIITNTQQP
jgi:Flp pilus assembly protein CpaB